MPNCDNHPSRTATTFHGSGAYSINLCTPPYPNPCAPPWFLDEDEDDPEIVYDGNRPSTENSLDGGEL